MRYSANDGEGWLLIEPMWNWNLDWIVDSDMALNLLIEPMWNWNLDWIVDSDMALNLLIEPMWNWNYVLGTRSQRKYYTFNRTNVELKLDNTQAEVDAIALLIEPMWNWNDIYLDGNKCRMDF